MKTFIIYLKYIVKGLLILTAAQISLKIYKIIEAPAVYKCHNPVMIYQDYLEQIDENIWLLLFITFLLLLVLQLIKYY